MTLSRLVLALSGLLVVSGCIVVPAEQRPHDRVYQDGRYHDDYYYRDGRHRDDDRYYRDNRDRRNDDTRSSTVIVPVPPAPPLPREPKELEKARHAAEDNVKDEIRKGPPLPGVREFNKKNEAHKARQAAVRKAQADAAAKNETGRSQSQQTWKAVWREFR